LKNKNYLKLVLDVLMSITFVLLFNKMVFGGLLFHEIAGIGIGLGIAIHIVLNIQWVKKVTIRLFDKTLPGKTRLGYLLNLLFLIAMIFIIVSGLFISKILFPNLRLGNEAWFKMSHISISYLTLFLISIHIGLHGKWIINQSKQLLKIRSSKTTGMIGKLALVILLLFGGYEIIATNFAARIQSVGQVFNFTTSAGLKQRPAGNLKIPSDIQKRPEGRGQNNHSALKEDPNPLGIITTYFGIMSVFAILTYYAEKFWTRRKEV